MRDTCMQNMRHEAAVSTGQKQKGSLVTSYA